MDPQENRGKEEKPSVEVLLQLAFIIIESHVLFMEKQKIVVLQRWLLQLCVGGQQLGCELLPAISHLTVRMSATLTSDIMREIAHRLVFESSCFNTAPLTVPDLAAGDTRHRITKREMFRFMLFSPASSLYAKLS